MCRREWLGRLRRTRRPRARVGVSVVGIGKDFLVPMIDDLDEDTGALSLSLSPSLSIEARCNHLTTPREYYQGIEWNFLDHFPRNPIHLNIARLLYPPLDRRGYLRTLPRRAEMRFGSYRGINIMFINLMSKEVFI